jgi:GTP pyrophosphokinase
METATPASPAITERLEHARGALAAAGIAPDALAAGAEAATLTGALTQDAHLALATLLHWTSRAAAPLATGIAESAVGSEACKLAGELGRLGELHLPAGWSAGQGLHGTQAEELRKMLLAVAADPRLVVARLAEQLVRLRHARELSSEEQQRLAFETRNLMAPLANRLGVWSLKWELEDLAFRYLDPEDYHRTARALAERRVDRERYIEALCARLRSELAAAGVQALAVYGRPKHIYSIWNKMQRKHVAFEQLFDVRAVRIVVESIADCYAALGVVHGLWAYIPGEFDDQGQRLPVDPYRGDRTGRQGSRGADPLARDARARRARRRGALALQGRRLRRHARQWLRAQDRVGAAGAGSRAVNTAGRRCARAAQAGTVLRSRLCHDTAG